MGSPRMASKMAGMARLTVGSCVWKSLASGFTGFINDTRTPDDRRALSALLGAGRGGRLGAAVDEAAASLAGLVRGAGARADANAAVELSTAVGRAVGVAEALAGDELTTVAVAKMPSVAAFPDLAVSGFSARPVADFGDGGARGGTAGSATNGAASCDSCCGTSGATWGEQSRFGEKSRFGGRAALPVPKLRAPAGWSITRWAEAAEAAKPGLGVFPGACKRQPDVTHVTDARPAASQRRCRRWLPITGRPTAHSASAGLLSATAISLKHIMSRFTLTKAHVLRAFAPLAETRDAAVRERFFRESVAPDVTWTIAGSAHSLAGTRRSLRAHADATFDRLGKKLRGPIRFTVTRVLIDAEPTGDGGCWACVETLGEATRKTGEPYNNEYVWLTRWDAEGRIVEAPLNPWLCPSRLRECGNAARGNADRRIDLLTLCPSVPAASDVATLVTWILSPCTACQSELGASTPRRSGETPPSRRRGLGTEIFQSAEFTLGFCFHGASRPMALHPATDRRVDLLAAGRLREGFGLLDRFPPGLNCPWLPPKAERMKKRQEQQLGGSMLATSVLDDDDNPEVESTIDNVPSQASRGASIQEASTIVAPDGNPGHRARRLGAGVNRGPRARGPASLGQPSSAVSPCPRRCSTHVWAAVENEQMSLDGRNHSFAAVVKGKNLTTPNTTPNVSMRLCLIVDKRADVEMRALEAAT
ncbi:Uncharacterized protein TCAP_03233 [Tolypocladium capitatum]|uniref:SnoaL-like domain-containing protein n=1 Tax=Tolypocladium capitatum TaxID=45235 RepID=A0A2K3QH39_9HYPO|nr:Uncharacterized protein TCAP_03233 [Tolypocladium capitatum]